MGSYKNRKDMVEKRRADVAVLYKAGYTQRMIGKELGIALGTVNRDVKWLRGEWQKQQTSVQDEFDLDVQRLNDALGAIAEAVLRGNLKAIDRWISIVKRRAEMYGYDAPKKTETDIEILAAEQIRYVEVGPPPPRSSFDDDSDDSDD